MSPKPDVSAERKQQIFEAAVACFGRQGYHVTTMDDIANEAGLSKGSLYWYFKGKKELFLALFQEVMEQFEQGWTAVIGDETVNATEKMLASVNLFRVEFGEMAPFFGVLLEGWAQTRHDEDVGALMTDFYRPYLAMMTEIINQGVATKEFNVESPEATALAIMSLFDGMTLAIGMGLVQYDWDQLLDAAGRFVLRGLGVEPGNNG